MTHPRSSAAIEASILDALESGRRDVTGWAFQGLLVAALSLTLLVLFVLLADVFAKGLDVVVARGWSLISAPMSLFSAETAGLRQGIVGSLVTLLFVFFMAVPLGVAAAVYLEEYAADTRLNRAVRVNIRNLAGVPSIVYGLLGLAIYVQALDRVTGGRTMVAAGLTLATLTLPLMIITASEALRAVPHGIREAGFGVGATRWEVVRSHVLPAAAPGILTGVVLSMARALGETAPILLVGAVTGFISTGDASLYQQLYGPYTTLPALIFRWAKLPQDAFQNDLAPAAIIVLLVMILAANSAAIILRDRYERRW